MMSFINVPVSVLISQLEKDHLNVIISGLVLGP